MYLLFSSLSVELPCKDSYYYFYNGFFTISNTVVLKEKRAENYQSLAPNEKSQGEHRNKQTRKKNQERTRFLWPDVCRQNTDPKGRPTRQGSSKRYITAAFSLPGGWQGLWDFLGLKGMRVDLFTQPGTPQNAIFCSSKIEGSRRLFCSYAF